MLARPKGTAATTLASAEAACALHGLLGRGVHLPERRELHVLDAERLGDSLIDIALVERPRHDLEAALDQVAHDARGSAGTAYHQHFPSSRRGRSLITQDRCHA